MGIEQKTGNMGVVTTTLENTVNWARTNAMWPMLFGLACCAIEMMAAQSADYDMSRFGMELMRASPRQSDLMIVAGRVSRKMAPVLRRLYDQMPDPKWVVSMGDCASCGGVFNNYAIVQGVDDAPEVLEGIRQGSISFSYGQQPYGQEYWAPLSHEARTHKEPQVRLKDQHREHDADTRHMAGPCLPKPQPDRRAHQADATHGP